MRYGLIDKNKVRALVDKEGVSTTAVAEILGVSRQRIYQILKPVFNTSETEIMRDWLRNKVNVKGEGLTQKERQQLYEQLGHRMPVSCPVLKTPLIFGGRLNDSASLDKLNPNLGYVPGNVSVISSRANRLKDNGTAKEHCRVAAYIAKAQEVGKEQLMEWIEDYFAEEDNRFDMITELEGRELLKRAAEVFRCLIERADLTLVDEDADLELREKIEELYEDFETFLARED